MVKKKCFIVKCFMRLPVIIHVHDMYNQSRSYVTFFQFTCGQKGTLIYTSKGHSN
jgi:hypothetical protein